MKDNRVSLLIADLVGVFIAKLSFVLNGRGEQFILGTKMQQLPKEMTSELLYGPNFVSKCLHQGSKRIIPLVPAYISNSFYPELCKTT